MPFSGFKTPYVSSGRWADIGGMGEVYGSFSSGKRVQGEEFAERGIYDILDKYYDPYPSWNPPDKIPISRLEIEAVFVHLTEVFGFQLDNTRNMFDHLLRLLDSRASRMGPIPALKSIHADYIGGINSNFRKWYFAAQLDIDDSLGFNNTKINGTPKKSKATDVQNTFEQAEDHWYSNMSGLTPTGCIVQVALYLLCWGEANNIRFMPECLCFIFKCCNDHYYSIDPNRPIEKRTKPFLDHVITPLYNFFRDSSYEKINGEYFRTDKDHSSIIGYDDMNQLFWYRQGLERIVMNDKTKLVSLQPSERYMHFDKVVWDQAFYKTYKERRTWSHILVNFNRIWIIHVSMFWLYASFNSPTLYVRNYQQHLNNQPTVQARLSVMALVGSLATMIEIGATVSEFTFVPRRWPGAQSLSKRLILLIIIFLVISSPSVYILGILPLNQSTKLGLTLSIFQFIFALLIVFYYSFTPLGGLFGSYLSSKDRKFLPTRTFVNAIYRLQGSDKLSSYGLWCAVFISKFTESYFFLILSLRDPVRELSTMYMTRCTGELYFGKILCHYQPTIVLVLIFTTDLVLFFLDTYLWYIIWNTAFSVCRSFYIGVSIWTPWRNIFSRLPKRIYSKILSTKSDKTIKAKILVSQVWNSIIIAMYREHLISLENVQHLIYQQVLSHKAESGNVLKEPTFFVSQEDQSLRSSLFDSHSEAERRITFFAQSLSTPMPEACSTNCMPTFSVLIPHYSEKITLSLKEIIKEEDQYSHVTLLEYLKSLHPSEWACFVRDTKMLADELDTDSSSIEYLGSYRKNDDLPYYSVGFKIAAPEYILRTRIWASLRSQTLYRTVAGFMNYSRAIKLLFDVENPSLEEFENNEQMKLEEASVMALRKFRIIVSMQRLSKFSEEEHESKEFLLRAYPELQIAYLEVSGSGDEDELTYCSCLIDGSCEIMEDGSRKPKYRIKLSGNPILGDGKSDNQNHSLIFCRGEYIQLVDANQDNYLEECLKIRSTLAEFEEKEYPSDVYSKDLISTSFTNPVAIIGTREYIFSENIGILGDVAAGKEQTFGTLFARTLGQIGGKLHYGHPDFLNGIFMTTRGGVSKAQKGLHLNEDIYAGINAMLRGGRIKHCEYMQCGKGRDLGFGSILNFTTKIGAGMGEQMLSREYFYLGTQLPLDRFLSFYYAHPGFHLNNVFIILSVQLFLIVSVNIAALIHESIICEFDRNRPITDPHRPAGCYNLMPVLEWLQRSIFSIFMVFLISFVPLCVQELTERGLWKAITRLGKHFISFSPLFEIFVCKIYAQSLVNDISMGGARYIATGRGFATVRVPFALLYARFAPESLYFAAFSLIFVLFITLTIWRLAWVYFWFTVLGLLVSPFLYNPNQFSWSDFFLDYKSYLRWLFGGNSRRIMRMDSWISYTRSTRARVTGLKSPGREDIGVELKRSSTISSFLTQISSHLLTTIAVAIAYLFANSQNDSRSQRPANSVLRIAVVSLGPIVVNIAILVPFFIVSCIIGPIFSICCSSFPSIIAFTVHLLALLNHVAFFEFLWYCQNWNLPRTILGFGLSILIQGLIFKAVTGLFLSREIRHDRSNLAWWSGKWITSGLGWNIITQPVRELFCKTIEMSMFVADFFLGHILLFVQIPLLLIPYIDRWHSMMLFWLKPSSQIRPQVLSKRQRRLRTFTVQVYTLWFLFVLVLISAIFILPTVARKSFRVEFDNYFPDFVNELVQPYNIGSSRKGLHSHRRTN